MQNIRMVSSKAKVKSRFEASCFGIVMSLFPKHWSLLFQVVHLYEWTSTNIRNLLKLIPQLASILLLELVDHEPLYCLHCIYFRRFLGQELWYYLWLKPWCLFFIENFSLLLRLLILFIFFINLIRLVFVKLWISITVFFLDNIKGLMNKSLHKRC